MRQGFEEEERPPTPRTSGPQGPQAPVSVQRASEEMLNQAEGELAGVEPASFAFSPMAFQTLKERIGNYINDLITESAKEARRHQADTISKVHVERASQYLVSSRGRQTTKFLGNFGGVLCGGGVAEVISLAASGHFPVGVTLTSIAFAIIGASMIAYSARE